MTTRVYEAKAALFARVAALAAAGQPLDGVQVAYAAPRSQDLQRECVYGGGTRFTHNDAVAERGVLVDEVALVSLYIRVASAAAGAVAATDARVAAIFATLAAALTATPLLPGDLRIAAITQGQGDYDQTVDETLSILGVQVRIESTLTYGGG